MLNWWCSRADVFPVSERHVTPAAPAMGDIVEIVDRLSGLRITAVLESFNSDGCPLLRYERAGWPPAQAQALLRWIAGGTAWQAIATLRTVDDSSAVCELADASEWEPAPVRRSLRAPVDNSSLLVKIESSSVLARGRRVHAVCLDFSHSGCKTSWPARLSPRIGDAVNLAWSLGDWKTHEEPHWVGARVARIAMLPFSGRHVGFTFEITNTDQATRVHAWHQTWLHQHRERLRSGPLA